MKIKFYLLAVLVLFIFCGCFEQSPVSENLNTGQNAGLTAPDHSQKMWTDDLLRTLDEFSELERSGSWFQGAALTESSIRENAGDYAGAIAAAYKELSWAYGKGLVKKEEIEQGLLNVLAANSEKSVISAANAILAFSREQWDEAYNGLYPLFNRLEFDEPDGFGRWMLLVCFLEKNAADSVQENRNAGEVYKSIRARYAHFPEYWYRGAKAFSGTIAAGFAENCINVSPQGPFSDECRSILASHSGIKTEDGLSIKTRLEIDAFISQSVNSGNPNNLDPLLPLIGLPDNPYTVYAVGALRALSAIPVFREYFSVKESSAKGRLAERLSYIGRV